MSNLSDIGFPVKNDEDINEMIVSVMKNVQEIPCFQGFYLKFADESGAQIYLQGNKDQELIGFNPHFEGKSRRRVGLTQAIERDSSELDGGFHAWAEPSEEKIIDSGEYPFVFDVPDFRTIGKIEFPKLCEIQLTAFASNDFKMFESEDTYFASQDSEVRFAAKAFVPSGLFSFGENEEIDMKLVRPIGMFTGEIKEFEIKTNLLTNANFYHILVETLGGEVDVVADPKLIAETPQIGGIVSGQFWLSGRLLN
jgi:hypothetical protein